MRARLDTQRIPQVEFEDASPEQVFAFLRKRSGELAKDEGPVNIVWCVRREDVAMVGVSFARTNASLAEILQAVCQAAGLSYRIEGNAVVIVEKP